MLPVYDANLGIFFKNEKHPWYPCYNQIKEHMYQMMLKVQNAIQTILGFLTNVVSGTEGTD